MAGQREALAEQLCEILDYGYYGDVQRLSDDPDGDLQDGLPPDRERVGTIVARGRIFDLTLARTTVDGIRLWLFSEELVRAIPDLHAGVYSRIETYVPDWSKRKVLALQLWQWLGLVAALGVAFLVGRIVSRVAVRLLLRPIRFARTESIEAIRGCAKPFGFMVALSILVASNTLLGLPLLLRARLMRLEGIALIVALAAFLFRLTDLASTAVVRWFETSGRDSGGSVVKMSRRVTKALVVIFAAIIVLDGLGFNVSALVAGVGIGGIAIALAAQKTIENVFGGLSVIADQPVKVGEFFRLGDLSGTLEEIGFRSVRIRTSAQTLVTVPNANFSTMTLENFSRRPKCLFRHVISLRSDATLDQVRDVLARFRKIAEDHPRIEKNAGWIRLIRFGPFSQDIELFLFILTGDNSEFLGLQEEVLLAVREAVEAAGTSLAVPTQRNV